MARSISAIQKKRGRGRPATGFDPLITMRLPAEMIAALDKRAVAEGINRSELLRRLIEAGLKRRPKVNIGRQAAMRRLVELGL
jgi:hypothetical protein